MQPVLAHAPLDALVDEVTDQNLRTGSKRDKAPVEKSSNSGEVRTTVPGLNIRDFHRQEIRKAVDAYMSSNLVVNMDKPEPMPSCKKIKSVSFKEQRVETNFVPPINIPTTIELNNLPLGLGENHMVNPEICQKAKEYISPVIPQNSLISQITPEFLNIIQNALSTGGRQRSSMPSMAAVTKVGSATKPASIKRKSLANYSLTLSCNASPAVQYELNRRAILAIFSDIPSLEDICSTDLELRNSRTKGIANV